MARAAMAALVVALQDPWSTAPAWGVPRASGRASQGGRASAVAGGGGDRWRAPSQPRGWSTAAGALAWGATPSWVRLCRRRDAGGRPRGVAPVGRAWASRARPWASEAVG